MSEGEAEEFGQLEIDPSVRQVCANGICMQTTVVEAKLDEGNIQEAESALREGLSLNFEVGILTLKLSVQLNVHGVACDMSSGLCVYDATNETSGGCRVDQTICHIHEELFIYLFGITIGWLYNQCGPCKSRSY